AFQPGERNQMRDRVIGRMRRCGVLTALIAGALWAATPLVAQDVMATTDDPRAGLAAGTGNTAGQALLNMKLVSWSPKPPVLDSVRGLTFINSDLAFRGNVVYQGNFSGFTIWDVSNPAKPAVLGAVLCATDQGDPSIYG